MTSTVTAMSVGSTAVCCGTARLLSFRSILSDENPSKVEKTLHGRGHHRCNRPRVTVFAGGARSRASYTRRHACVSLGKCKARIELSVERARESGGATCASVQGRPRPPNLQRVYPVAEGPRAGCVITDCAYRELGRALVSLQVLHARTRGAPRRVAWLRRFRYRQVDVRSRVDRNAALQALLKQYQHTTGVSTCTATL